MMNRSLAIQPGAIRQNLLASIVVSLVAIPLCLGIALACDVPLYSGIIAGVIGGIVVGLISESRLSVSGPAAGMITVVLASIHQLGSFEAFLLALLVAGGIQIICGILRGGFIANFVPSNVIKGLLAAIGILIIIKQLPLALGYYAEPQTLQHTLEDSQETFSFAPFFDLLKHINITSTLVTLLSFAILTTWDKVLPKLAKVLPASVIVVLAAVAFDMLLEVIAPGYALPSSHLVNIPVHHNIQTFFAQIRHPDFSQLTHYNIYIYGLMIAVVASLETLLNLEAVEQLDKRHRYCSRNRELVAQGVGNMISGMIGGLPITSVIVRSSVNINAGASSKLSTISHGILLLLSLSFLAEWLNYIPIAALAAILIHTGYKLARISLFREVYGQGMQYFIPFVVTVIAIVFSNLLEGIIVGLIVSVIFILYRSSKTCFTLIDEIHPSGEVLRLVLPQQVTFINKAAIVRELNELPNNSRVILDAKYSEYIDNDILHVIKEFMDQAADKGILLNLEGFEPSYDIRNKVTFITATTYSVQATLTPEMILRVLQEGNNRFVNNMPINKNYKQQVTATSKSQHPIAVVLSCIDSRVPVEIVFDLSVGDVFVSRVAGNIANNDILGSIEFACKVAGAKQIVVLGHKECGAIKAACDDVHLGHVTDLLNKIKPAIQLETETKENRNSSNDKFVLNVTENNIKLTTQHLYKQSSILRELIETNQVGLTGALYDVKTGEVEFIPVDTKELSAANLSDEVR